ncbi:CpsD/CapB family tyrosine-protein kinase [Tumebacillus flagellatus]|uniref:non-specific protein-tyrosine kinase n=1 Tax=Tumebacillus flagellatus TaxID=1157490 RepID=A0A074LKA8_9BACL|nr:CpsD/CapB family tyrosine-protein kinase [Tumebacillus flagellatus]KEO81025.1 hypothetical protein EL26_23075 [Tumebacillus flagellatus]
MRTRRGLCSIVSLDDPKSPAAEAYRTLRTNLLYTQGRDEELKTILITSTKQGEGKSTVISNLAVTMIQAGQNVLLIDADLRKPFMHHVFPISNVAGLSHLLTGECRLDDALQEVADIPGLLVLTAGTTPPNPAELLGSKAMQDLVAQARDRFDMILIDTPPLLPVTDAQVLAPCVDGALLVVHSGKVASPLVKKSKGLLAHVGIPVLGAVLNQITETDNEGYFES